MDFAALLFSYYSSLYYETIIFINYRDRICPILDSIIPNDPLKGYDIKAVMKAVRMLLITINLY